jgi:hypothetical protein
VNLSSKKSAKVLDPHTSAHQKFFLMTRRL